MPENKSHLDEVRPFVLFMLTGGLVVGTVMVSLQRYLLGLIIGFAGCGRRGLGIDGSVSRPNECKRPVIEGANRDPP